MKPPKPYGFYGDYCLKMGFDYDANSGLPTTDLYKEEMKISGWWFERCSKCLWMVVIAPHKTPKCKVCGNSI